MALSPIDTPLQMMAFVPMKTLFPMMTGAFLTFTRVSFPPVRTDGSVLWKFVSKIWTPPPIRT